MKGEKSVLDRLNVLLYTFFIHTGEFSAVKQNRCFATTPYNLWRFFRLFGRSFSIAAELLLFVIQLLLGRNKQPLRGGGR